MEIEITKSKRRELYKELLDVWKLKNTDELSNDKISVEDGKVLESELHLSYFYQTHLLPQPWWGNIESPKILILALNPSYDPINDERDEEKLRSNLLDNLQGKEYLNWLDSSDKEGILESSGYKFWTKSLGKILVEGVNEKNIYNNIGFFNLCGYHSNPYKNIPKRCFKKDFKQLPTQSKLISYLNFIIEQDDPYVIVLWGYDYWKQLEVKNKSKLVIVNKYKGRNHNISKIYDSKRSPRNVEDFLQGEKNALDKYKKLIENIKIIIQN